MILTIVRHGQSQTNVERKLAWCFDTQLTEKWISQAQLVGRALAHASFDVWISSDLQRASKTMELILASHEGVLTEHLNLITDRDYKTFAKRHVADICEELWCTWENMYESLVATWLVESDEHYQWRVDQFISYLLETYMWTSVLMVNHKSFTYAFLQKIVGKDLITEYPTNCSITKIDLSEWLPWKIISYNETSHLE